MLAAFLLQNNAILHLKPLKELFGFHDLHWVLKCKPDIYSFFRYNTLRAIVGLFFSNFFQSSFPFQLYLLIKVLVFDILCSSILCKEFIIIFIDRIHCCFSIFDTIRRVYI